MVISGRMLLFFLVLGCSLICFGAEFRSRNDEPVEVHPPESMVYVMVVGENCVWCDRQKEVLSRAGVQDALGRFVVSFVDVRSELARSHKVRAVPTSMVLDSEGNLLKKNVGYMDEERFVSWLNR